MDSIITGAASAFKVGWLAAYNEALSTVDELFSRMYESVVKCGRRQVC